MLTLITVAALSWGDVSPPELRVPAAGLRLSQSTDAQEFARRVADRSRDFCAVHRALITPEHVGDPRFCERGMADLAVAALPKAHRRDFRNAGGLVALRRMQR